MRRRALATPAATLLVACGTTVSSEPPEAVVADSAGIEIVQNGTVGRLGELGLTETLRLGELDAEGPEQFADIRAIAIGGEGRIVVGNNGSVTARVFRADGTFEAELGGRGEGPSETTMVNRVLAFGDTVVIIDWQRGGKAVSFSIGDGFLTDQRFLQADGRRINPVHRGAGGWLAAVNLETLPPQDIPDEGWRPVQAIHEVALGSAEVGSQLYEVPLYVLYRIPGVEGEFGVDWSLLPSSWFSGYDAEGRLYINDPTTYRIDVHDRHGLRRSIRKVYDARPFTEQDVADVIDANVLAIDTMSRIPDEMRAQQVEQVRLRAERQSRMPRPETVPPIGGLLVSPDGSFWVERWDVHPPAYAALQRSFGFGAGSPSVETTWELFGADGVFRGTVTLPMRYQAYAVEDLTVVGVWRDELDVEYVVRYEVGPVG